MKDLNFDLKHLVKHNKQGSYATQSARHSILQQCANQLYEMGYGLPKASSIKPKHIEALVEHWSDNHLNVGTIKNRLSHLRWWARQVGKLPVMRKDNIKYGIGSRESFKGHRAFCLSEEVLERVSDLRTRLALQLAETFGLRREEALKLRPFEADKGDCIRLKASWTKGGRERDVPLTSPKQRELLNALKAVVGKNCLIESGKTYVQQMRVYNKEVRKAGLSNPHGLRHQYAQGRYMELTGGMKPPVCGGTKRMDMTEDQRKLDIAARLLVSKELGHNRLEITNVYLGGAR